MNVGTRAKIIIPGYRMVNRSTGGWMDHYETGDTGTIITPLFGRDPSLCRFEFDRDGGTWAIKFKYLAITNIYECYHYNFQKKVS